MWGTFDIYYLLTRGEGRFGKISIKILEFRDFEQFNETNLFKLQSFINLNLEYMDLNDSWLIWKNTFLNIVNRHMDL